MMTVRIELPSPHAAQLPILKSRKRFKVLACGRRFGKTTLSLIVAAETALRGGVAWIITPNYPQSTSTWENCVQTLGPAAIQKSEDLRRLRFPNGGILAVRSGHEPDSLRGDGLDLAVLDEAAFMPPTIWHNAVRPALSDRKGKALFLSTPNGLNWYFDLFHHAQSGDSRHWGAWQHPTTDNPYIPAGEVDAARGHMPELIFMQEYLAQFLDDSGAVFRGVRDVCVGEVQGRIDGHVYVVGCDWGRLHDATAYSVYDATAQRQVYLDRFTGIDFSIQRDRLVTLYQKYVPRLILSEENSIGLPQLEALKKMGLPVKGFKTTAQSKPPLIEGLALAMEQRQITLLNDQTLIGELLMYEQERRGDGGYKFSAPSGKHDDTVIATALSVYATRRKRGAGSARRGRGNRPRERLYSLPR